MILLFWIITILILIIFIFYEQKYEYFEQNELIKKKRRIKCKYFPSYSQGFVCPEKYSSHLGASFGAKISSGIMCNGSKIKINRAKAYVVIKDKSIHQVKIINNGSGYVDNPKVKLIGKGQGGKLKAIVDSQGKIKQIKIINPGRNYEDTPKIWIEEPNGYLYCHLCCRIDD